MDQARIALKKVFRLASAYFLPDLARFSAVRYNGENLNDGNGNLFKDELA